MFICARVALTSIARGSVIHFFLQRGSDECGLLLSQQTPAAHKCVRADGVPVADGARLAGALCGGPARAHCVQCHRSALHDTGAPPRHASFGCYDPKSRSRFSLSRTALHDAGALPRHRFVWSLGMVAVVLQGAAKCCAALHEEPPGAHLKSLQGAALRHPPLHRRTVDATPYLHMLCQQRALKHRTVPHEMPAGSAARVRR